MPVAKKGDRVRMTGIMPNDPDPIPVGDEGEIIDLVGTYQNPQIRVRWDSGRSLMLLPNDPFEIIGRAEK